MLNFILSGSSDLAAKKKRVAPNIQNIDVGQIVR